MKTKKISWQAIAIVVLALVLIASIALGVSGAWFQDKDEATSTATMAEAVTVKLADTKGGDVQTFKQQYGEVEALPGDQVLGGLKILLGSDTQSVVRVKITTEIKDKNGNVVTATAPTTAYEKPVYYKGSDEDWKKEWTDNFNLLDGIMKTAKVDETKWESNADSSYWYYKTVTTADDLTNSLTVFSALVIPTDVTNVAEEWTVSVIVTVDAIQAANLSQNDTWYNDLPTTIKGNVDNLVRA